MVVVSSIQMALNPPENTLTRLKMLLASYTAHNKLIIYLLKCMEECFFSAGRAVNCPGDGLILLQQLSCAVCAG